MHDLLSVYGSSAGVRSLAVSEAKRGPPRQLPSWQSAYSRRLDALGYFECADIGGYTYPSELVRTSISPSSDDEDAAWDPDRDEDGEDVDEEMEDIALEAEEEVADVVLPAIPQGQDLERCVLVLVARMDKNISRRVTIFVELVISRGCPLLFPVTRKVMVVSSKRYPREVRALSLASVLRQLHPSFPNYLILEA